MTDETNIRETDEILTDLAGADAVVGAQDALNVFWALADFSRMGVLEVSDELELPVYAVTVIVEWGPFAAVFMMRDTHCLKG